MLQSQLVIINLGNGNLNRGFDRVYAQLYTVGYPLPQQFTGSLPPAPHLIELHRNWQSIYRALCDRQDISLRGRSDRNNDGKLEIEEAGITSVSEFTFEELSQNLEEAFNSWLRYEGFLNIERQLRTQFIPSQEIRIVIQTSDLSVLKLPWQLWDFYRDYPQAEIAFSKSEYKRPPTSELKINRNKVRILAVLGNSQGIDLEEENKILQDLDDAETVFLVKPSRLEFNKYLWDEKGWDILFFAGHSHSERETGRIYLNEDTDNNSIKIEQLEEALKAAIARGLKLAIFNSCDGLGLGKTLEKLNITTSIVMREPVPNLVAQQFFKYFILAFAKERLSLYLAVQQGRRKLQGIEDKYLGASWLPVIFQNPAIEPQTWLNFRGIPPCPYQGLSAFSSANSKFFFGREEFTYQLINAVENKPLVVVIGTSGSGKSSVVNAGLIPQLQQQKADYWEILSLRPKNNPFAALALALLSLERAKNLEKKDNFIFQNSRQELELSKQLRQNKQTLAKIVANIILKKDKKDFLLLVIDQFEELFTLCELAEWQFFVDSLIEAISSVPNFSVVITLRADFYGIALAYPPFGKALQKYLHLPLIAMSETELKAAIERPAKLMSVQFEAGLTARIINSVTKQPGSLPLLEFTLTQLWSKQKDLLITHEAYNAIGGVEKALANYAETIYEGMNAGDRQKIRKIFMQLIQPGIETEDTRRIATKEQVKDWDLVQRLADRRLVVTNYNKIIAVETVEIVHEALIKNWQRLQDWIEADREFRKWQERLRRAIEQWQNSSRDEDLLWRGKSLIEAENWLKERSEELSEVESIFIKLSQKSQCDRLERQKRRTRATISALGAGLILALSTTSFAWIERRKAQLSEIQQIAKSSTALLESNNNLEALIAAIKAKRKLLSFGRTDPNTETEVDSILRRAILHADEYNRLLGHSGSVYQVTFSPNGQIIASASEDKTIKLWHTDGSLITTLTGHSARIKGIKFSPNGQTLASASDDKTIKLWRTDGTLMTTLTGHSDRVNKVAFSPDGKIIASASDDKTIKLWRTDGTLMTTLTDHSDRVNKVAFSPDGKIIASASDDKTIKLWRTDGTIITTLTDHSDRVYNVAFSPDGQTFASASEDKTVKLWTVEGNLITTLSGHSDRVFMVSFNPDGKNLASASDDRTVKLWRSDGTFLKTLSGHDSGVVGLEFSPDGKTIASASSDNTIKLWRTDRTLIKILTGYESGFNDVAFSPDGKILASASNDNDVSLWDRDGNLITSSFGHTGVVYDVAFSPDGQTLASASADRNVKLWRSDGTLIKTLSGHSDAIYSVAFSPDGQTIASASADKTIRLWHRDGTLIKTLSAHKDLIFEVAFSPDGQTIASASGDKTIRLWHRDGTFIKTLRGHDNWIFGVAFSPDGQTLVTSSWDSTIKLWSIDGTLLKTLRDRNGTLFLRVAFSPDGNTLAVASWDNTVKLWNVEGTLISTLTGHSAAISGVAFSPDGQTLASAGDDRKVILWNLAKILNLDELAYGCDRLGDYLRTNPQVDEADKYLCQS